MPACASLSIAAVADQVGGVSLPDPVVLAPSLQTTLAGMVDPRERRGIRHGLTVVLTAGGQVLAPDNQAYNTLHRATRCRGERGFALLTSRWRALQRATISPRRIGQLAQAALVLTRIENFQLRHSC